MNKVDHFIIFGSLAVLVSYLTVDPWLCVAGFHPLCLYRCERYRYSNISGTCRISHCVSMVKDLQTCKRLSTKSLQACKLLVLKNFQVL